MRGMNGMFKQMTTERIYDKGFRRGMWTALLISSPFIVAGVKWMMNNKAPLVDSVKGMKKMDLYTQFFDKDAHEQKTANRKLDTFRKEEGNFGSEDINFKEETSSDQDLMKTISRIVQEETAKEKGQLASQRD
jgi:hypothetical protein